ncbi:uncharacterized protein LOC135161492 [Diachasmimorpha longicaudata]|uniref:uncharacterized protein LOC135161492 n=1 Tax=Diachasmimorpha longicaudata TaxID=58733 RepID=UPI0030B90C0B
MPVDPVTGLPTPATGVSTIVTADLKAPPFKTDKYYRTIPLIDTRSASEVEDLIINPPTEIPSREANLLQLLDRESIGDRTPSQYLRYLRSLVPDIDEEVLRTRWISHLPEQTKVCLIIQKNASVTELGELADKLHEVFQPTVTAISGPNLEHQIAELTKQVAALSSGRSRPSRSPFRTSPDSRKRRGSRSRSRKVSKKFETCWYHFAYGDKARSCLPGCKFQGKGQENQQRR